MLPVLDVHYVFVDVEYVCESHENQEKANGPNHSPNTEFLFGIRKIFAIVVQAVNQHHKANTKD
jgi:hypothetical protein